jgi:hypothetical protein
MQEDRELEEEVELILRECFGDREIPDRVAQAREAGCPLIYGDRHTERAVDEAMARLSRMSLSPPA